MEIAWGEEKLVPWIVRPFSFPMEYNLALFSSIRRLLVLRILISFSLPVAGFFAPVFSRLTIFSHYRFVLVLINLQ